MSAYFFIRGTIHDLNAFQEYKKRSPDVLARFGGHHIARGGKTVIFEGETSRPHVVIAEFPDFETAERCYRSQEYQAIIPFRTGCATLEFVLVDGISSSSGNPKSAETW